MSARITLLTATSIAITVGAYALSRWIGIRRPSPLTVPVFLATPMVMVVITVTHIGLSGYSRAGGIVTYFLGPATVALAVPFYRRRRVLLDNMVPLCAGLVTGTVVAMVSAVLLARLFGQSHALQAAFSLKTATAGTNGQAAAISFRRPITYAPMAAAFSTSFSSSITCRLASAAAMARSFCPNVLEWTTHRSIELKTLSMILGRVMMAPTGT